MQVAEIEPRLWRWTARHPEWTEDEGGPDGWEAEVACVYWEAPDAVVLIDPLVPGDGDERERFWRALDVDVERLGRPVLLALTCPWHVRSTDEIVARYEADLWSAPEQLPGAAAAFAIAPGADEVVLWLPGPRTLVVGDVLLGSADGGLRLCPPSWLGKGVSVEGVREALRPLLELPIERVLASHHEPMLEGGRDALALALQR